MKLPFAMPAWFAPRNATRLYALVGVLLAIFLVDQYRRWWRPTQRVETAHYAIASSASPEQTRDMADRLETLHQAYLTFAGDRLTLTTTPARLKLNLFRDRAEFRRCNRVTSWMEAFYSPGERCCYAYCAAADVNPYHWMLHEATHQLNHEVAGLDLPRWLDEGVATYFSTSVCARGIMRLGEPDVNTYPLWWFPGLTLTGDMAKDTQALQFIPLRIIVEDRGGPDIDTHFNTYYMHWWSLTHFLLRGAQGKYRDGFFRLLKDGGTPAGFEKHIGPFERVESEWYRYLCEQRKRLG